MNKRLKYLLEKEKVAGLDKQERYELIKLMGEVWIVAITKI